MVWLSFSKPWDMLRRQSPIYLIGLIRELRQFWRFWQKLSGH
ncbi:hypothetical protein Gogos_020331 [Gossypium gossypioides]|uniref:Uncharacterized protein n=1 Tax=Gossypium gossypioides TaxID=34282 RepID=A0A7J9CYP3_GOSGO|nr:hypothetical protein [Gossypium gossypioides]